MRVLNLLSSGNLGGIEQLNLDIYKYSSNDNLYCFMFTGGVYAERLREMGAYVRIFEFKQKHNIFSHYREIKKIIKKERVDAVVVHPETPFAWICASIICRKLNIPFYVYAHCNMEDIVMEKSKNRLKHIYKLLTFKLAAENSTKIIAISDSVKKSITERLAFTKNKVVVNYNGVELNKYISVKRNYSVEHSGLRLIFAGRLVKVKGVDLLLNALAKLDSDIVCTIVGDGEEKTNLENLSEALGISDRVNFAGRQSNIEDWYAGADLLVHPAVWQEGFGITLIEAMASGIPCLAFRKGAIPEIITDNIDGFLTDDVSIDALVEKINDIASMRYNDNEKYILISKNARKRAEYFSIEKTVHNLDYQLQEKYDNDKHGN